MRSFTTPRVASTMKSLSRTSIALSLVALVVACKTEKEREDKQWEMLARAIVDGCHAPAGDLALRAHSLARVDTYKDLMRRVVKAHPDLTLTGGENAVPGRNYDKELAVGMKTDVDLFRRSYEEICRGGFFAPKPVKWSRAPVLTGPDFGIFTLVVWVEKDNQRRGILVESVASMDDRLFVVNWVKTVPWYCNGDPYKKTAQLSCPSGDQSCDIPTEDLPGGKRALSIQYKYECSNGKPSNIPTRIPGMEGFGIK